MKPTYDACDCVGLIDKCSSHMDDFIRGIKYVEHIRVAIDAEATEAPGRLRDRFEFLVKNLENIVPYDEARNAALSTLTAHAVKEIDRVRNEMMAAKTKYVAHNLPVELKILVDVMQARLMADAIAAVDECVCTPIKEA